MSTLKTYAHYLLIAGLVLMLLAAAQLSQDSAAWAGYSSQGTVPTPTPETQPTAPADNDDDDDDDDDDDNGGGEQAPPPAPVITNVDVSGQLIDPQTGSPLADILIRVGTIEARTDTDGRFTLAQVPVGDQTVVFLDAAGTILAEQVVTFNPETAADLRLELALPATNAAGAATPAASAATPASSTTAATPTTATGTSSGSDTGVATPTTVPATGSDSSASATPTTAAATTGGDSSAGTPTAAPATGNDTAQAASTPASSGGDTTAPASSESAPGSLPETGGSNVSSWFLLLLGGSLTGAGLWLKRRPGRI